MSAGDPPTKRRVLVVGSGGREHAICLALADCGPGVAVELYCAPGNSGTAECAENVDIKPSDQAGLVAFCREREVDLVVVGPEQPLCEGLCDGLEDAGIHCCGPRRAAAQLEGSKAFTRRLGARVGLPSPHFVICGALGSLGSVVDGWPAGMGVPVVKADGLAGGKGVYLPDTRGEALAVSRGLLQGDLGDAGRTVVLEERLSGVEISLFYGCAGRQAVALPHARDHKRLLDGDRGPNTGGMGAISPNPIVTPDIEEFVRERIVDPLLGAMDDAETPFFGFLFVGVMLVEGRPKLLEINVRLGDPEAQAILPRLGSGALLSLCNQIALASMARHSGAEKPEASWLAEPKQPPLAVDLGVKDNATCAVVLASAGYPASPRQGDGIQVDDGLTSAARSLIHAGMTCNHDGLFVAGGRVAAVVAAAGSVADACEAAYAGVLKVHFEGMQYRRDIGGEVVVTTERLGAQVAIMMGSASDIGTMKGCRAVLDELEVSHEVAILSAHRTPEEVARYVSGLRARGVKVVIAAAGMAAHLAGVVAAHTRLPVLGVPISAGTLGGVDALLSTVQMPPGVPVASLGVGSAGGKNAAQMAARIIATADEELWARLEKFSAAQRDKVLSCGSAVEPSAHGNRCDPSVYLVGDGQ